MENHTTQRPRRAKLLYSDPEPIEVSNGLVELAWGLSFLFLHPFHTTPTFHVMAELAPDYTWGIVFVSLALARWWGVLFDRRQLRRFVSMLASVAWFFVTVTFILANPRSPTWVSTLVYALASVWVFIRISMDTARRVRGWHPLRAREYGADGEAAHDA